MTARNLFDLDRDLFHYRELDQIVGYQPYLHTFSKNAKDASFPAFWALWLEKAEPFVVRATAGLREITITVRPKRFSGRKGVYWFAQAKVRGRLRQKYIGSADNISLLRLEALLAYFADLGR